MTVFAGATGKAKVVAASAGGFEIVSVMTVAASPADTYAALAIPARWWQREHTYSGDSGNLTLDPRAGGCFCETVPADGGTIEHGRIVQARPGSLLRLNGALGPLQQEAVSATLTWSLKPVAGGTEITQSYVVAGIVRGGADTLAGPVDQVMSAQLQGLARYLSDQAAGRRD